MMMKASCVPLSFKYICKSLNVSQNERANLNLAELYIYSFSLKNKFKRTSTNWIHYHFINSSCYSKIRYMQEISEMYIFFTLSHKIIISNFYNLMPIIISYWKGSKITQLISILVYHELKLYWSWFYLFIYLFLQKITKL